MHLCWHSQQKNHGLSEHKDYLLIPRDGSSVAVWTWAGRLLGRKQALLSRVSLLLQIKISDMFSVLSIWDWTSL